MGLYSRYTDTEEEALIDHLKQIASMMESRYGKADECLNGVSKDLKEKFLKQEAMFKEAKRKKDGGAILKRGKALIRAWKVVDAECVKNKVKAIPHNVWTSKHSEVNDVTIKVVERLTQLPDKWDETEAWITIDGLIEAVPPAVIRVKSSFAGSMLHNENLYDDPIPF